MLTITLVRDNRPILIAMLKGKALHHKLDWKKVKKNGALLKKLYIELKNDFAG